MVVKEAHLKKMSLKELVNLGARIEKHINARQAEEKEVLKQKIKEMAADSGFTLGELVDGRVGKKRGPVAAKYRHPSDPTMTWTGRGRMPKWLAEKVKAGQKKDRFLIK